VNSEEQEFLYIYRRMMEDRRRRLNAIEALVNDETGLEARFAREASYLHLRMICETIALVCIIAHEGFSDLAAVNLKDAYAADKIINALSKLHDRFYPQPIIVERRAGSRMSIRDNTIEHLSKEELKAVYHKCGGVLHRGTPMKIRTGEEIEKDWIAYVIKQTQLAVNLLAHHALVMRGDQRAIFCGFVSNMVWAANAV
jgi:hypothetical protein